MSRPTAWAPSFWKDIFDELLYEEELDYGDPWTLSFCYSLTDTVTKKQKKRGFKVYSHCAHGNFRCASCRKTWPSARAVVLFHYRLRKDRGSVVMRPFGQACRRCQDNEFYLPGFPENEVERALRRLMSKIRKNCYGDEDEDSDGGSSVCSTKVQTKPHEASLCEACVMGICCQDDD